MILNNSNISKNIIRQKLYFQLFFIIFYLVGVIGIHHPYSRQFFITLIPYVLLMSFLIILIFHESNEIRKTYTILLIIGIVSFLIEVLGVKTGIIFGNYQYGSGLGIKLFETPLMIIVNWVMLVYCTSSIAGRISTNTILKIFIASLLMVFYDIIVENVAPFLNMWHWSNMIVPLQNYFAWFIIAIIFQTFLVINRIKIRNQIAFTIFICQALFFLTIIFFINHLR